MDFNKYKLMLFIMENVAVFQKKVLEIYRGKFTYHCFEP